MDTWQWIIVVSLSGIFGYLIAAFFIGAKSGEYYSELISRLSEVEKERRELETQVNAFRTQLREVKA